MNSQNNNQKINAHTVCGVVLICVGVASLCVGQADNIAQQKSIKSALDVSNLVNSASHVHSMANFIQPNNIIPNK